MFIEETEEETSQLMALRKDPDPKIALLAEMIFRIVRAADAEEDYRLERRQRR